MAGPLLDAKVGGFQAAGTASDGAGYHRGSYVHQKALRPAGLSGIVRIGRSARRGSTTSAGREETTMVQPRTRLKFGSAAALGVATTALLAPPAGAADSGPVLQATAVSLNNGQVINACMVVGVNPTSPGPVTGFSTALAKQPNNACNVATSVPGGYLGASVTVYRNGALCSSSGVLYMNPPGNKVTNESICRTGYHRENFYARGKALFYKGPSVTTNAGYVVYQLTGPSMTLI
jgi:hypothetical protein